MDYIASDSIPLVDLSHFSSPSTRLQTARALVQACHEIGFVYIINHGIPHARIEEAFSWNRKFFALPNEKKALAKHNDATSDFRGWMCLGLEQSPALEGEEQVDTDWNESYGIGADDNLRERNIWAPESVLPGFRKFTTDFHGEIWEVAKNVLRALSIGLGLPDEDFLLKFHGQRENELSLRHYPPVDMETPAGKVAGIGAHTDFDSFTMLWQDGVGGLEVKNRHGKWIDVQNVEGALVMNIGDVLQRWSNDYLISTPHRVQLPLSEQKRHRFSIPYFTVPRMDVLMEPLESNLIHQQGKGTRHKPMLFGDFHAMRLAGVFKKDEKEMTGSPMLV